MSIVSQLLTPTPKKVTLKALNDDKSAASVKNGSKNYSTITLPLNPDTISSNYQTGYQRNDSISSAKNINDKTSKIVYVANSPERTVSCSFILDETLPEYRMLSVQESIETIESLCSAKSSAGGHAWLSMQWGEITYIGLVNSLSIQQTLFNRGGAPIQARVNLSLTNTTVEAIASKGSGLNIPSILVLEATTLTALLALLGVGAAAAIAVSASSSDTNYLQVAADNDLDSLNALPSGSTLVAGN